MSWLSVRKVQVAPPSSERKRPPESASMSAHTRAGLAGEIARPMLPSTPLGRPALCVSSVQLSPPSTDLKMPPPVPPLLQSHGLGPACPTEAESTLGFDGWECKSRAPVEALVKN